MYDNRITGLLLTIRSTVAPHEFVLHQNYPNPFRPENAIRFDVPMASRVTLRIYDALGKEVGVLVRDMPYEAGRYEESFDASYLASGMYFYSLVAQSIDEGSTLFQSVKEMVVVR